MYMYKTRSTWFSCTVPGYSNCRNGQVSQYVAECAGLPATSVVESRLAVTTDVLLWREAAGLLLSQ